MPAPTWRKRSSMVWPCAVWSTSGCHCTPYRRLPGCSKAAISAPSVRPETANPPGATTTASRCDIHTGCLAGWPENRTARRIDGGRRAAELGAVGALHRAAEGLGHGLEPVADAEHRDAGVEQRRIDRGRTVGVDARRSPGQHDGRRLPRQQLVDRRLVRHDLAVDPGLAHPPGDELRVLGAEVDDEDERRLGAPGRDAGRVTHRQILLLDPRRSLVLGADARRSSLAIHQS